MYKEYRFPVKEQNKAGKKLEELKNQYGYRFPVYRIQSPDGQDFLSIVFPEGLQPKPKKSNNHQFV